MQASLHSLLHRFKQAWWLSLNRNFISIESLNSAKYGNNNENNDRSEEANFENSKVGPSPQVVH
ncbi:MAG: hypothetical protein IKQ59_02290 [Prevotella sp.]|nr:hypothetical protein [Prevotella sp.]